MIPGYPTPQVQRYMSSSMANEEKRQRLPRFQIGRLLKPFLVQRCGWKGDDLKKTYGGLVSIYDQHTINHINELESQVQLQYPDSRLNSVFTREIHDPLIGMIPVARIKFSKGGEGVITVNEYGRAGDTNPTVGHPSDTSELTNGHLCVALVSPKPWNRDGVCGITLYANKINVLGHLLQEDAPEQRQSAAAPMVWE